MFKYFCGGSPSEHCSCTHVGCATNVINRLLQEQNISNNNLLCRHIKFGNLIVSLINIIETAINNINEVENEIKYLLYTGHYVNGKNSLLSSIPIELVCKINDDVSKNKIQ